MSSSQHSQKRAERKRLEESDRREVHWKRWGPYLAERQWGTVREDYGSGPSPWESFPHDHARSRAYRWGEDGIAGLCDRRQTVCFALGLWNGADPILKERLFGLSNHEGNHGEDVKEYYFYLDSTPTHSYMRYLYKYPQRRFPYEQLVEENASRGRDRTEFELIDTGIFEESRYFDVFVEYAKTTHEDVLIRITAWNRGPDPATLHLLPTLWFRNTWSWGHDGRRPHLSRVNAEPESTAIRAEHPFFGERWLLCQGSPNLLFTENETNRQRLYGQSNPGRYVKDAFHSYLIDGDSEAVNPRQEGTKAAAGYQYEIEPGKRVEIRLRWTDRKANEGVFEEGFEQSFRRRKDEADEFYESLAGEGLGDDLKMIQRQAFAGLLWTKQTYNYEVRAWLEGDPGMPSQSPNRKRRNEDWQHLHNSDVLSMPDKWEFPWYAAWDLAFHCVALALVDPDFAKAQLLLLQREWYQHPNGQLPAYEWNFSDVNPPVHAWACWRVYKIERKREGEGDLAFLEKAFHKLLLNFTWWVNRKDPKGRNVFQGGFLGMDNIGVFDRSAPLPGGGRIEQSDGTSWMAMYCLNMLAIALELARHNPNYEDVASKFFEHFAHIAHAVHDMGGEGIELWDEEDRFYYDVIYMPDGSCQRVKLRSMVGLTALFAVEILEPDALKGLDGFRRRMNWFIENHPDIPEHLEATEKSADSEIRRLLTIVNKKRLIAMLQTMLDEAEFLSPFGIRSLSRHYEAHPFTFDVGGVQHRVEYAPGESTVDLFGGNSNWRGPVWFPVNFLLIESLQKFHYFFGDDFKVEFPSGSGKKMNLWEASAALSCRLMRLFLPDSASRRPIYGDADLFQSDPHWRDLLLFHEYFHAETGKGLGASHQTGWTALIAKLILQSGEALDE